jgi:hypothetical protein
MLTKKGKTKQSCHSVFLKLPSVHELLKHIEPALNFAKTLAAWEKGARIFYVGFNFVIRLSVCKLSCNKIGLPRTKEGRRSKWEVWRPPYIRSSNSSARLDGGSSSRNRSWRRPLSKPIRKRISKRSIPSIKCWTTRRSTPRKAWTSDLFLLWANQIKKSL